MAAEVNLACPTCGNGMLLALGADPPASGRCQRCGRESTLLPADPRGPVRACAACGATALFVQRDFNRKLGIAIVAVAALFAVKTWGLSLVAAALIDLALYRILPRITVCYACDAIHRGVPVNREHQAFDHEVAEEFKEPKSRRQVAVHAWRRAHESREPGSGA